MKPEELDPSVTARIPVFISEDDRYFQDKYQGIPREGYSKLFERMLDRPNIKVLLDTDFFEVREKLEYDKLFFSGMIDQYYDYCYGRLPYRSLEFNFEKIYDSIPFQPVAQVNYPCDNDYTRITEFLHFQYDDTMKKQYDTYKETIIAKEFSIQYSHSEKETPYYPIPQKQNIDLYNMYKMKAEKENVVFLGRLADYSYYNMDQVVEKALAVAENNKN